MKIETKINLNEKLRHLEELREKAKRIAEREMQEEQLEEDFSTSEGVTQADPQPQHPYRGHQEEALPEEDDQLDFDDLDTFTQEESRREREIEARRQSWKEKEAQELEFEHQMVQDFETENLNLRTDLKTALLEN